MTNQKKAYSADFKREAVQLWGSTNKTASEVEQELGITSGLLGRWKRKLKNEGEPAFPGQSRLSAEQARIRQLERDLRIAEQERDILKKAMAIFTQAKD